MARRPFLKRFPGFRSRSIAGVRLRSPSGNGYAAPPIPAALGDAKVLHGRYSPILKSAHEKCKLEPQYEKSL